MRNYKDISEIDLERVSYLLSTSELLEEMLDEAQSKTTKNIDAKFSEALDLILYMKGRKKNPIYHLEGELSQT